MGYCSFSFEQTDGIEYRYIIANRQIMWSHEIMIYNNCFDYHLLVAITTNEIATIVNEEKPVGSYEIEFGSHSGEVRNLASGVYFYIIQAGIFVETKKMLLMK